MWRVCVDRGQNKKVHECVSVLFVTLIFYVQLHVLGVCMCVCVCGGGGGGGGGGGVCMCVDVLRPWRSGRVSSTKHPQSSNHN